MAKLIEYMPVYYRRSKYIKDTVKGVDNEILQLTSRKELMLKDFIVDTASDSTLQKFEFEYDLPINPQGISIGSRRSRIKAKMRTVGTSTKELIENVIEAWSNADVEITEDFGNYNVFVTFVNQLGIPENINDVYEAVQSVIPAHLGISYKFKFRRHEELGRILTHAEMKVYTHQQLSAKSNNNIFVPWAKTHQELSQYSHHTIRQGVIS